MNQELIEQLAALSHEQWSGWMKYLFSVSGVDIDKETHIPREYTLRWLRQMDTPYAELSEIEQKSDRKEAERMLEVVTKWMNANGLVLFKPSGLNDK